jgi:hypothetical protein
MRNLLPAIVAAAMFVSPLTVRADQPGGPPLPPPDPAAFQAFEQAHAKVEQLHALARQAMLNTLSQAQRSTLAQIVGQLAIAPNPDVTAAARQIDGSLTPAQAKNILSISTSLHQQSRQLMEAAHKQMMSAMPPGGPEHPQFVMKSMHPGGEQWENDAGMILLMTAMHSGGLGEFHHMAGAVIYQK